MIDLSFCSDKTRIHYQIKPEKILEAYYLNFNRAEGDIDISETLSNLTAEWIKKITADEVEFQDGTKVNLKDLDYKLIKPLIWWE